MAVGSRGGDHRVRGPLTDRSALRRARLGDGAELVPFSELSEDEVLALIDEPRNARHLPLASSFDRPGALAWAAGKDAQWDERGYGPWAIRIDGRPAGWGGFQFSDGDADLALVLLPEYWGRGSRIGRAMLRIGFEELGFDEVTILLPYSRDAGAAVARWSFAPAGERVEGGVPFRRFVLTASRWRALDVH